MQLNDLKPAWQRIKIQNGLQDLNTAEILMLIEEPITEATRPYHEHCIEHFGPERCMFESNFPVDALSCSYPVLWNSFKRIASGCSDSEKQSLFHDTAAKVYRLS